MVEREIRNNCQRGKIFICMYVFYICIVYISQKVLKINI